LFQKFVFGLVAAYVHVIEFRKRGFSHAHILVIMKPRYKITTPGQYDKILSAQRRKCPILHLHLLVCVYLFCHISIS